MKKLDLVQMQSLEGGDPGRAFACGLGLVVGIGGMAVTGGLSLVAVFACV